MTPDVHDPQTRSYNMSRIQGRNTKPEVRLRSLLHQAGLRFRIHQADLPGKPDIVLSKYRTVIFVNGCFWHRHEGCRYCTTPKARADFWAKKFSDTIQRDHIKREQLEKAGWRVFTIWECELRYDPEAMVGRLVEEIKQKE